MSDAYAATLPFVAWEGAFTPAELDRIEAYGDGLPMVPASVRAHDPADAKADDAIRVTQTAWIARNGETDWFYDRMERLIRTLNDQSYQLALSGFSELFQYSVYHGHEGGFFDWHVDQGHLEVQRKLSLSLQLSDGDSYEGCDLQFFARRIVDTAPRGRGVVVAFPAYVLHRVTPCTGGTRKAVVAWTTGPKFR